jgi:hypothetical protein
MYTAVMKLTHWQTVYLWLFVCAGLIALIAYLRILFFYNSGHINFSSAPPVLLVLSLPLLASGMYGLLKKESYAKQPAILRAVTMGGTLVFVGIVLMLIAAMVGLAIALKGSGAFQ